MTAMRGHNTSEEQQARMQAQSQVDVAKINLDMAKNQQESLIVRAPTNGIIGEVIPHKGDIVSPQSSLTQIVNPDQFVLKVGVNADDALKITNASVAQVLIGGKYIPVGIKTLSPTADATSKLVTVTLTLPHIFFRANQTLDAQISLSSNMDPHAGSMIYVPLDALIIGTQEKYVYVYDNGKARKVNVTIGAIEGDQVEVLEGLQPNDQVILEGAKDLLDGQAVTLD
jgi:RND family efflux transporter MFP subunit